MAKDLTDTYSSLKDEKEGVDMALLGMSERERNMEYNCIDLLPDLEEAVLYTDMTIYDMESNFTFGIDEWWAEFIEDISL